MNLTIANALRRTLLQHGDAVGYIDHGRSHTFNDLEQRSDRLAGVLHGMGLARGDRIALLAQNQIEWVELLFAAAKLGVTVVALNPRYRDGEAEYMLSDAQVRAVFTIARLDDFDYLAMFQRLAPRLPTLRNVVTIDAERLAQLAASADCGALASLREQVTPEDVAVVIYTSGTTGRPKGCALTHRSLLAAAQAQALHMRLGPEDLLQLVAPLNHVGALSCSLLPMMLSGGTCELVQVFKAETMLRLMEQRPPTILFAVPTVMAKLLMHAGPNEAGFRRIRIVSNGGASVDPAAFDRLRVLIPHARFMNLYGLTEASGMITGTALDCDPEEIKTTVGRPFPGAQVRVLDDEGREVPVGAIGEISFKGLGVVNDYIGAAAGSGAFHDGWLRTGDLGSLDEQGRISLRGRAKDMFIQGGYNVYPAEVEALLNAHPDIVMAAGIGVADPVMGEIGRYYVVPRPGSGLTVDDVLAYCKDKIADYKVPRQIVLREELPLTPAGKVQKASLRSEANQ
jgi:acyl-CoA synthetase (AMP-forming)/AMP-acid ligase II